MTRSLLAATLLVLTSACGAGRTAAPNVAPPPAVGPIPIGPSSAAKLAAAVERFVAHDRANDWNAATCAEVAGAFEAIGKNAQALFDAGLAYQRCHDEAKAKARLTEALAIDPTLHHARAQLALHQYKADGDADRAIAALEDAVKAAHFQNVPALVDLATMQATRAGKTGAADCKDDLDCAKLNLQRALALDDAYTPAHNQLALYYLKLARLRAAPGKKGDVQQLELAALVCAQAIKKNPTYAPIHNTDGLIQMELGRVNAAVAAFGSARTLDPDFFEAQMNYAAVNLGFRGFAQAEQAYRRAIELRPNDYDAHLGLATALRGPLSGAESNHDQIVQAAQAELDAAKKIDPRRPDAFYNEGILRQESKAKAGGSKAETIATLRDARTSFEAFLDRAADKPAYAAAVKRVKGDGNEPGRLKEIDDTISFLR